MTSILKHSHTKAPTLCLSYSRTIKVNRLQEICKPLLVSLIVKCSSVMVNDVLLVSWEKHAWAGSGLPATLTLYLLLSQNFLKLQHTWLYIFLKGNLLCMENIILKIHSNLQQRWTYLIFHEGDKGWHNKCYTFVLLSEHISRKLIT